jgi:hypothetical protein
MLKPIFDEAWPALWNERYHYDDVELWGSRRSLGYTYACSNRHLPALQPGLSSMQRRSMHFMTEHSRQGAI